MILTGSKIQKEVEKGKITITPFDENNITTNSYDLSLGNKLIRYTEEILDPRKENSYENISIPKEGFLLPAKSFHLASSVEVIGSDHYVPLIHARSGIARLGLFVHITADLIDIGYEGTTTFQLYATLPIRIFPGMKIAQITFWKPKGKIELYSGKYQGSSGPRASKIHKDKPQSGDLIK